MWAASVCGSVDPTMDGSTAALSRCCSALTVIEHVSGSVSLEGSCCSACSRNVSVLYDGTLYDVEDFLVDLSKPPGFHWFQDSGPRDRAIQLVLSQLVYQPDMDKGQVPYDAPDDDDVIKLAWSDQRAVGFYTVKPAGVRGECDGVSQLCGSADCMPTLDTAYLQPSLRHRGLGQTLLTDLVTDYPLGDLGLSHPLSDNMTVVVKRFLEHNPEMRKRFWLIKGESAEGNKTLLWLELLRRRVQS